jgi:pyruvate/2-oxoglutarate dehydrogenase complex dihydrolipoamide dehydrogenase (E3) component
MAEPQSQTGRRHDLKFDLAVIGAGAAGLSVAYGAARLGLRVALIERAAMGGECLNTGCIPSKALLHQARQGVDWPRAQARIRAAIATIAPVDSADRYESLGVTVMRSDASFTGPDSLDISGTPIRARRIVIATGSRPKIPEFCARIPHLTNETIWDLQARPEHLLIIGGGPMAFEMADAFANLGAKVTVAGPLLPREDAELAAPLIAALRARGVTLIAQRAVDALPGPIMVLADGSQITGTHLLIAAGREVDCTGLNLQAAGIEFGPDGIKTDAGLCAIGGRGKIFAAGDCADPAGIGPQRFTHIAGSHAGILLRRIVFRLPAKLDPAPPVRAIYTSPELAQAGFTLAQAGEGAQALTEYFSGNDRAIAENATDGLVKLVLDKKSRLIGAGITGPGAGDMIGLYALVIAQKTSLSALAGLILPYPTRTQAGQRAVSLYLGNKLFTVWPKFIAACLARLP